MMYLWCLCTLYLLACHVSYHWQLRSLLLYLCNIFSEIINSLVWWCWPLNYYEIPKLSKPWPKIPWQQAVPICSYPCLSTEPMITATHKAQRNLFYCTFDNKLESTILQAKFTHTNKNTTDTECHLWFITQYMIWQYICECKENLILINVTPFRNLSRQSTIRQQKHISSMNDNSTYDEEFYNRDRQKVK